jgi:hypothetical protein
MDGLRVSNFGSASFSFAVRQICYGRCGALSSLVVKLRRWRMAAGDDNRRSDFAGTRQESPSFEVRGCCLQLQPPHGNFKNLPVRHRPRARELLGLAARWSPGTNRRFSPDDFRPRHRPGLFVAEIDLAAREGTG